MDATVKGSALHSIGDVTFYGGFELDDDVYVLDDPIKIGKDSSMRLYRLLTVSQQKDEPVMVELTRLYRPTDLEGGPMPYHSEKELILSNTVVKATLNDLGDSVEPFILESRRAFILRTEFPSNAYFYNTTDYYWVDCPKEGMLIKQVQERPINVCSSEMRKKLPSVVLTRARDLRLDPFDDTTDSHTSLASNSDQQKQQDETNTHSVSIEIDLVSEDSLLIDLEKSNGGSIGKSRTRLRRLSSALQSASAYSDSDSDNLEDSQPLSKISDTQPVIDLSMSEDEDAIESPMLGVTTQPIWALGNKHPSTSDMQSLDKDDWLSKGQQRKALQKRSERGGTDFRSSLAAATTDRRQATQRTSQLAKISAALNNYNEYASLDGVSTVTKPPILSEAEVSLPLAGATLLARGMVNLDNDNDDDDIRQDSNELEKGFATPSKLSTTPSATPAKASSLLPVSTWRSPGQRQTKISFPKASSSKNGLDDAVLVTDSMSPQKKNASNDLSKSPLHPASAKKKKAVGTLQINGIAPLDGIAILMEREKARTRGENKHRSDDQTQLQTSDADDVLNENDVSTSTAHATTSKKRARPDDIVEDEEDKALFAEIGISSTGPYKLRQLAPLTFAVSSHAEMTDFFSSKNSQSTLPNRQANEVDEEDDNGEMEGFIVDDDDEIEYDTKNRFVDDEDDRDPDLRGYMRGSDPDLKMASMEEFVGLDLDIAFKRYMQYLISSVINVSFASTYIGEGSKKDAYFSPALRKIRDKIFSIRSSLLASSVWNDRLKEIIDRHPFISSMEQATEFESTCQACRRKHVVTHTISLYGREYDSQSYWNGKWIDNPPCDSESETITFSAGSMCAKRIVQYHRFQHLQYLIVQQIIPKVEKVRNSCDESSDAEETLSEAEILEEVLNQESWLQEMQRQFESLLANSTQFGLRAGTKQKVDEYNSMITE